MDSFMKFGIGVPPPLQKSYKKIQVSVKCDKNNQCFTCTPKYINDCILLPRFQTKVVGKIKSHSVFNNCLKNHVIVEIMWKNIKKGR